MQADFFSKPTEFVASTLMGGRKLVSSNSKHLCRMSFRSDATDEFIIEQAIKYAAEQGKHIGKINIVDIQPTGFYAGAASLTRTLFSWEDAVHFNEDVVNHFQGDIKSLWHHAMGHKEHRVIRNNLIMMGNENPKNQDYFDEVEFLVKSLCVDYKS